MTVKDILLFFTPLLAGILGSYLTYYFTKRSRREEAILKFKEEKYARLLVLLQGFVGNTASTETKRQFFEEQYKSWLYSSDEVVHAINRMVQIVTEAEGQPPNPERGRKAVGDIVLAMRRDLLHKTTLRHSDFTYTSVGQDKRKGA